MGDAVKPFLAVALSAVATVLVADLALGRITRMPAPEYETADALRDYADSDPDIMMLGSSYVRSFLPLQRTLRTQQPPREMAIIPIEGGKFYAYEWLLAHRFIPLVDDKAKDGTAKLKHLIVVTNYWDICGNREPYPNLPARAWALSDYLDDFVKNGATPFNGNYVDQRVNERLGFSALVRDRGIGRILRTLRERVHPKSAEERARLDAKQVETWSAMCIATDMAREDCLKEEQDAALDRILQFAEQRHIEVTFIIWPAIPKAVNAQTLAVSNRFRAYLEDKAHKHNARLFDFQETAPLTNEDFRPDLDHLEHWGDEKVSEWARTGPLSFLTANADALRPLAPPAPHGGTE